jgi:hypothetical protein
MLIYSKVSFCFATFSCFKPHQVQEQKERDFVGNPILLLGCPFAPRKGRGKGSCGFAFAQKKGSRAYFIEQTVHMHVKSSRLCCLIIDVFFSSQSTCFLFATPLG